MLLDLCQLTGQLHTAAFTPTPGVNLGFNHHRDPPPSVPATAKASSTLKATPPRGIAMPYLLNNSFA